MGAIIITIINEIYRAQNSQGQQMRQVSCCMMTVILEQEHGQHITAFPSNCSCLPRHSQKNSKVISSSAATFDNCL